MKTSSLAKSVSALSRSISYKVAAVIAFILTILAVLANSYGKEFRATNALNSKLGAEVEALSMLACVAWERSDAEERTFLERQGLGGIAPYENFKPPSYNLILQCILNIAEKPLLNAAQSFLKEWSWGTLMFQHLLLYNELKEYGAPSWLADSVGRILKGNKPWGVNIGLILQNWLPVVRECKAFVHDPDVEIEERVVFEEASTRSLEATKKEIQKALGGHAEYFMFPVNWIQEPFFSIEIGLIYKKKNSGFIAVTSRARDGTGEIHPVLLHELLHIPLHQVLNSGVLHKAVESGACVFDYFKTTSSDLLGYDSWHVFFEESLVRSFARKLQRNSVPIALGLEPLIDLRLREDLIFSRGIEALVVDVLEQAKYQFCGFSLDRR